MAELNLTINGRTFGISCDDGQEQRVLDLGHYVDARLKEISSAGAANNESHLLVLTALMLTDEIFDLRDNLAQQEGQSIAKNGASQEDDLAVAKAIDSLADRIDAIARRVSKA